MTSVQRLKAYGYLEESILVRGTEVPKPKAGTIPGVCAEATRWSRAGVQWSRVRGWGVMGPEHGGCCKDVGFHVMRTGGTGGSIWTQYCYNCLQLRDCPGGKWVSAFWGPTCIVIGAGARPLWAQKWDARQPFLVTQRGMWNKSRHCLFYQEHLVSSIDWKLGLQVHYFEGFSCWPFANCGSWMLGFWEKFLACKTKKSSQSLPSTLLFLLCFLNYSSFL